MIIIQLFGGLGNQMFQYAFGKALAYRNKTRLMVDARMLDTISDKQATPRKYGLHAFRANITLYNELLFDLLPDELNHIEEEAHMIYDQGFFKQAGKNAYICGYWQSWKYFQNIESLIRKKFQFTKNGFSEEVLQLSEKLKHTSSVSIHIRRTDYFTSPYSFISVLPISYYYDAVKYIAKYISNPAFYVFSDDPDWVIEHFKIPYERHVIKNNTDVEDLYLMTQCKHNIIANSTFSWWGAWLNTSLEKIVLAPESWFEGEHWNTTRLDILPPEWISIPLPKTEVLHLSTSSCEGGAAIAAYRVHLEQYRSGINSKMLTLPNAKSHQRVYTLPVKLKIKGSNKDSILLNKGLFSRGKATMDIYRHILSFDPKILHLHWINDGFISIENIGKIRKTIIWFLHDCWPFTGGCHYFGECDRYIHSCGKCPLLNSEIDNDWSREVWERKYNSWQKLNMIIVAPTPWMKEVAQKSSLFSKTRIEIIPNGLDINKFSPLNKDAVRKLLNISSHKKVILYGAINATWDKRKGFELLLLALQKLSAHNKLYEVIIFGADEMHLNLNISVKFLGVLQDHISLQMAYSSADVMVVPSLQEAFGQTVTEAMACGVPVVTFSDTGPAGIVDHQVNGYVAKYGDINDLAEGISWVLEDEERRRTLSQNAREKVLTHYDIRLIVEKYIHLYNSK